MNFCEFLAQGWGPASLAALVAVALAIVVEYVPAYDALQPRWKQLVYLAICIVIGFGTWGAGIAAGCSVVDWWTVILAIAGAFTAGTAVHRVHAAVR